MRLVKAVPYDVPHAVPLDAPLVELRISRRPRRPFAFLVLGQPVKARLHAGRKRDRVLAFDGKVNAPSHAALAEKTSCCRRRANAVETLAARKRGKLGCNRRGFRRHVSRNNRGFRPDHAPEKMFKTPGSDRSFWAPSAHTSGTTVFHRPSGGTDGRNPAR